MLLKNKSSAFFCGIRSKNDDEKNYKFVTLKDRRPEQLASSDTHHVFVCLKKVYGFGLNEFQQISAKHGRSVSIPVEIDFGDKNFISIAAGNGFTLAVSDKNHLHYIGKNGYKCVKSVTAIRGVSAFGDVYTYIKGKSTVQINFGNREETCVVEKPLLLSLVNSEEICVVGVEGDIFLSKIRNNKKVSFRRLEIEKCRTVFSATNYFIAVLQRNSTVIRFNKETQHSYYLPPNFNVVNAGIFEDDFIVLDDRGRIGHCHINESNVSISFRDFCSISSFPLVNSINSFSLNIRRPFFVLGLPCDCMNVYEGNFPIKLNSEIKFKSPKTPFVLYSYSKTHAYFDKATFLLDRVIPNISHNYFNSKNIYHSAIYRLIEIDDSNDSLFKVNLLKNDIVKMYKDSKQYIVVGVADGYVWVKGEESDFIYAIAKLTLEDCEDNMEIVSRKDHILRVIDIGDKQITMDLTPSFMLKFGYSVEDLVWVSQRGTCQVIGCYANMLVLCDLSNREPFLSKIINYKVLRREDPSLPHTRNIIDSNGKLITLDIDGSGNKPYLPTDRVSSPYGIGTIIGFRKKPYIQTDEMRANGQNPVAIDIREIHLVRRIGRRAKRKIYLSENESTYVYVDTLCPDCSFFPGDVISSLTDPVRIVGYNESGWYVVYPNEKYPRLFTTIYSQNVIYRADIDATVFLSETIRVGSPFYVDSNIIPGDLVEIKDIGLYEFVGYTDLSIAFISLSHLEIKYLPYTTLLLDNIYVISKRPTMDLLKQQIQYM